MPSGRAAVLVWLAGLFSRYFCPFNFQGTPKMVVFPVGSPSTPKKHWYPENAKQTQMDRLSFPPPPPAAFCPSSLLLAPPALHVWSRSKPSALGVRFAFVWCRNKPDHDKAVLTHTIRHQLAVKQCGVLVPLSNTPSTWRPSASTTSTTIWM